MATVPTPGGEPSEADQLTQTPVVKPRRPLAHGDDACLVHIYPTGPTMGSRYRLGTTTLVLGRGDDCDIRIEDFSVSRRHASVAPRVDGYVITDLNSTNGTFVNDQPTTSATLRDGDYVRVGKWIYRFLAGGNVENEYHEEIYRLTIIDALTQTHNRRYLTEFLDRELARSHGHGRPLSLVLFDIDKFKTINDEYGHLAGDHTLRELVRLVKGTIGPDDLLARYGGEEFAVVLVETPPSQAVLFAEKVRAAVARHPFEFDERKYPVTVSLGVAGTPGYETLTATELIRRADDRLYQAKNGGRNRVVG
jgi:two-component system cell cycle response regulator